MRVSVLTLLLLLLALGASRAEEPAPTFERDVKPVLAKRCNVCHRASKIDDPDISAGLALDSYEAAIKGTSEHAVIVVGDASKSELFQRLIDPDEDRRMPLSDRPLADPERELLRRWIDQGAIQGEPIASESETSARPRRRLARSLDVVIPTAVKAPPSPKGLGPGGAVEVALKVGPLPSVTALAFRGDGRLLAVGSHGAVVLWDLVDVRPALILGNLPGPVHALEFSRDGRQLAVGSGEPARSGSVLLYEVPGGTLLHEFSGHGDVVFGLSFRPDGAQLASASLDQTVRFWDLARGRPAGVFRGHSDFVYDVAYERDGKSVLSVSKDRSIKRIDLTNLKELRTYSEHNDDVLAVAAPPRGGRFVTAGHEPQLRWWLDDGVKSEKRVGGHSGPVHQLVFSGDGSKLISASGDGSVRLWDGSTGSQLKTLPGATDWQYAAALSFDGALAAAAGWDGLTRVWDTATGKLRVTLIQPPSADPSTSEWLAIAPQGMFAASPEIASLMRWRVGGQEVPADRARVVFEQPESLIRAVGGETVTPMFP